MTVDLAQRRLRPDEQPDRLPPHNVEAEEAILGSALLDREVIGRVSGIVSARDFYRERHGTIFQAMLDLYERSEPVDFLTLTDELERSDALSQVGGITYLTGLLGVVPTPIHAEQYAKRVAAAAVMRRLISAGGKIATIGFQNQFDPETALEKAEQILFDVSATHQGSDWVTMLDAVTEYMATVNDAQAGDAANAVPSGFHDLDSLLCGGFQRSDLVILAARPSMGKTALCLGFAANLAIKFSGTVGIFSLEMSRHQLVARLLSMESGISTGRLRTGDITDYEGAKLGHAMGLLAGATILIDDTPGGTVTSIRSKARRLHERQPLDLIVIDHLQLMTSGRAGENRVQEVAEITRQLKGLARELHVPVLVLSQLSRAVEQRSPKIPHLADLRDSGSIEQDADVVMFIYRDDYYNRDSERQGVADILVAKHRNGPTGQASLLFNQQTTRFLDLEAHGA